MPPSAFIKALSDELSISDLTELEVNCLMRVLAKQELGNQIIVNEFALIMENFGVPLIDGGTLSDEEDYIPCQADQPKQYDLKRIDEEGMQILIELARHLLKEYMHPREFFGKTIKNLDEIKTDKRTFRVDTMPKKEFYLKVKIANLRKSLVENQSLNEEMCLDPVRYPDLWNVKNFIRALEDIAEVEQERLCEEKKATNNVPASPGSSPPKSSDQAKEVDAL